MLAGEKRRKFNVPVDEFKISAFGILHLPTGTRFVASPLVQRYGFFLDRQLGMTLPGGKKYSADELHQTMRELWRKRMDTLDPNGPIEFER